jgi:antitoxin ParD1/3/4
MSRQAASDNLNCRNYQSLIVWTEQRPEEVNPMPSSYVIGEHFETFIKAQIQQGRYASASEVIRDGLRTLEEREKFRAMKLEALRAEIQKGADSGPDISAEQVFAELRANIARVAQETTDRSERS